MQNVDIGSGHLQISGLKLMRRIKNDPKRYLKRSDLFPKNKSNKPSRVSVSKKRELEFLTADIDQSGYINFRIPNKRFSKG